MNITELPFYDDAADYFDCLSHLTGCIWLHSGDLERESRYDIITALPTETIGGGSAPALLEPVTRQLEAHRNSCPDYPFTGGWIGFLGYQTRHSWFGLDYRAPYSCGDAWFGWYDWAIIQDRQDRSCRLLFTDICPSHIGSTVIAALSRRPAKRSFACGDFAADQSKSRYMKALQSIQRYIVEGDCYQVNYTQRFSANFEGSPAMAFHSLRRAVPSPFSAYIGLPHGPSILSISPERFIRVNGRLAMTQPIKGTAARSNDIAKDLRQQEQLLGSAKNRAENLMIVDLLRNDFNRHCLPNTVKAPKLFQLQSFANVHHLVSTIEGELAPDISHFEFLLSCFPGGSITGAPKKRSMEIIEELEPHARGVYCGAIGYLSSNDRSDFNIAIRTFYQEQNRIYCWGGGGIVEESDPEQEFRESCEKVARLCRALDGHGKLF